MADMDKEIWVGLAELSSSPAEGARSRSRGKGAFTWWACWATDVSSFEARVSDASQECGLFVTGFEHVMTYQEADSAGLIGDELAAMAEHALQDEDFCISGAQHQHSGDH